MSRLDAFMLMFPPKQLTLMITLTNRNLTTFARKKEVTKGELIKFLGILILMTRVKGRKRRDLWRTTSACKYLGAYNFGSTGMSRHRWEEIWSALRWSEQAAVRPDGMSHERWRWHLISDFVKNFNDFRATNFLPSDLLCIDESMSKWYGLGGQWINIGLPMYVAMERKPVSGCEIQNVCCARSRIMMQIKIVESMEEENTHAQVDDSGLLHGVNVMLKLLHPWKNHGERIVCADSYFASVSACEELLKYNFRFIGVVKTATKKFPMAYLAAQELAGRGDHLALVSSPPTVNDANSSADVMAILWVDRNRRYFVSNAEGVEPAEPIFRIRWRQVDDMEEDPYAEPERTELNIPQPAAVKLYYDVCGSIDKHNRQWQDDLELERCIKVSLWWKRVAISILGMIVVDTCNFHQACVHPNDIDSDPNTFYSSLAEEMIDNTFDEVGLQPWATPTSNRRTAANVASGSPIPHLTPTREKKRKTDGTESTHTRQGRCLICKRKTTYLCNICNDKVQSEGGKLPWYCHEKNGHRECFTTHIEKDH